MRRSILVVEDDEQARGLIAAALTRHGHEVLTAADNATAQELWTQPGRSFDLLISDVKLEEPDDGFMLAEKLLESRPGTPVMFISGDKDCFASPALRWFGDAPFIAKPFIVRDMIAAVNRVLDRPKNP